MKRFIAALLLSLATPTVLAQAWPAKPVRIINAFAPGGPSDLLSRAVGDKLQGTWGQPVIVEAKPGADGLIGMEFAAKSPADGYTIVTVPVGNAVLLPNLRSKLPYDMAKDFVPITLLATVQNVLVVGANVPANTLKELIAYAKANPGKLSFASPGAGSSPHIAGEMLKSATGMDMIHVAYKGTGPALNDVMGGQVTMFFSQMSSALPLVKQGKLKGIGVASLRRHPAATEIPTIAEQDQPGFEAMAWYALFAPAGTPLDIVNKIAADATKALQLQDVKDKLSALGADPVGGTPEEFALRLKNENARWGAAIRKAGIKLQD
ncbi:MAG: tripartite tricarboxylate transporter substrate binding protein [Betaproteobacteria bacterium]|nr:tripartite tricarboxylate transporter substrate binding protein [Betaproteobacteria bacterium]